ncbi:DMT family transporter [Maribellus maritimus]|uniref:DMT family transporter n=1 Tax=Maribellus maritimus TaxID=2870838 RepID=UPI001EEBD2B5|nr:DMT family transporter [Maribellus maritimus]MCG6190439.1 DMT family transporter [Maribellus maritimus]
MQQYFGEIAGILTAVFWTVTSLAFESAGKKVGSLAVNLIRLVMAFFFIGFYSWFSRGFFFPSDATFFQWKWLVLSGMVGFVIGDLLLFQAFVVIGARISMLMMALAPPFTAFIGWLILKETLTPSNWLGMMVTMAGIILVILKREKTEQNGEIIRKLKSGYSLQGILLAVGGAMGQATGLVLSKKGMGSYDAFSASQIRVLAGVAGFSVLFVFMKRWPRVWAALKHAPAMKRITLGAFFGPFLGVSFSLLAVQHTEAGVAATLMAISPVLIIAPSVIWFGEKVNWKEILGALITVGGVALFFL